MIKRYFSVFLNIFFVATIILVVNYVIDYHYGRYFLAGDFRLHIDQAHISEYFTHIFSTRFSVNAFMYIPFFSLFLFLQLIPYQLVLISIFFGIPICLYFSMKMVLLSIIGKKNFSVAMNCFLSSLAFYYAVNPALFDRYVHFTILYGGIFFPPFLLSLYRYFKSEKVINKYLFATPLLLFLGNVTPQLFVIYICASLLLFFFYLIMFLKKKQLGAMVKKSLVLGILCLITILHVVVPVLSGFLITKSLHESSTTDAILARLSERSNIISSISGTHQFNAILEFPTFVSSGLIIFILTLLILMKKRKREKADPMLLVGIAILLLTLIGYGTFPYAYQFINLTPLSQLLWLVKDTSTYYIFYLALIIGFVGKNIRNLTHNSKKLIFLALAITLLNIFFFLMANKRAFNDYYKFLEIPKEYFDLSKTMATDKERNLWLPPQAYVTKTFTKSMTHFPSAAFWLTKNREITYMTSNYQDLIMLIDKEIYKKKCSNKNFINWLIGVQKLNIIIDENSINNSKLGDFTTEDYISIASDCMRGLPNVYLYKSFGKINVYKSNLPIRSDVIEFSGTIEELDKYVKDNPVNVIVKNSANQLIRKLSGEYAVLNESYDRNWLSQEGEHAITKVNFSSMLFKGSGKKYYYRNYDLFEKVVFLEKIFIGILFSTLLIYAKKKHES